MNYFNNLFNFWFQASNEAELSYAKNLLAKKFVSHGEEVVGSKPKNAFIAGSMVVALWAQHADFGQVFYAYLLDACPYLIPKYHQRPSNATGLYDFTGKKKLDLRKVLVTSKTFLV